MAKAGTGTCAAIAVIALLLAGSIPSAAHHLDGATLRALPGSTMPVPVPPGGGPVGRHVVTFLYNATFSGEPGSGNLFVDFGDGRACAVIQDGEFTDQVLLPPLTAGPLGRLVDCKTLEPRGAFPVRAVATEPVRNGVQVLSFDHLYPGPGNYPVRWRICCSDFGGAFNAQVLSVGL